MQIIHSGQNGFENLEQKWIRQVIKPYNSTQEGETGGLSLRQPGLHNKTLSQKNTLTNLSAKTV